MHNTSHTFSNQIYLRYDQFNNDSYCQINVYLRYVINLDEQY